MNVRSADLVAYTLLVGAALAGVLLWPTLPDSMAIHFGAGGEPDSFVAKPIAVVLAPAIGVASVLLIRYAPEWASRTRSPHVETLSVVFVGSVVIGGRDAPTLVDGEGFVAGFPALDLRDVERVDDGVVLDWVVK